MCRTSDFSKLFCTHYFTDMASVPTESQGWVPVKILPVDGHISERQNWEVWPPATKTSLSHMSTPGPSPALWGAPLSLLIKIFCGKMEQKMWGKWWSLTYRISSTFPSIGDFIHFVDVKNTFQNPKMLWVASIHNILSCNHSSDSFKRINRCGKISKASLYSSSNTWHLLTENV